MLKSQYLFTFALFLFSFTLFGQDFVLKNDFKDLAFYKASNEVKNGFAQLKLLEDTPWLKHSSKDVLIYFQNNKSQYASINVDKKQYIQTELCCYPTKDLFYDLNLTCRISPYSLYGISFVEVYLLSNEYKEGQDLSTQQLILLPVDPKGYDWQQLKASFRSNGNERYLLVFVNGEYKNDLVELGGELAYSEDVLIDIQNVEMHLTKGQKDEQKVSRKVEF